MRFEYSKVTKSRLMGSIGLYIHWSEDGHTLDQFFLLDAEGDGIADYVGLHNASAEEVFFERQRLMGGLGSAVVRLTKKEALTLLYDYGRQNITYNRSFPGVFEEYGHLLKKDITVQKESLLAKICHEIREPIEFINYLTMRFVARDISMLQYFSYYKDERFDFLTDEGSTLLRNMVTPIGEDTYSAVAIVEDDRGYYRLKIGFRITYEGRYYYRAIMGTSREALSHEEVQSWIHRKEYLAVFHHKENDLEKSLLLKIPGLYRVPFEHGVSYTHFKSNNNHVKEADYRISNDLAGIYLIKDQELVFAALDEFHFNRGIELLDQIDGLILEEELYSLIPIIYEYAKSDSESIYDFIGKNQ